MPDTPDELGSTLRSANPPSPRRLRHARREPSPDPLPAPLRALSTVKPRVIGTAVSGAEVKLWSKHLAAGTVKRQLLQHLASQLDHHPWLEALHEDQWHRIFSESNAYEPADACYLLRSGAGVFTRRRGKRAQRYTCLVLGIDSSDEKKRAGRLAKYETADVHRLVCWLVHGPPTAQRDYATHSCHRPACVRPSHLSWDSQAANVQQAWARRSAFKRSRSGALLGSGRCMRVRVLSVQHACMQCQHLGKNWCGSWWNWQRWSMAGPCLLLTGANMRVLSSLSCRSVRWSMCWQHLGKCWCWGSVGATSGACIQTAMQSVGHQKPACCFAQHAGNARTQPGQSRTGGFISNFLSDFKCSEVLVLWCSQRGVGQGAEDVQAQEAVPDSALAGQNAAPAQGTAGNSASRVSNSRASSRGSSNTPVSTPVR